MLNRGLLIVFEGVDRSGKTTISTALNEKLNSQKRTTNLIRFPDRGTETGALINNFLTNKIEFNSEVIHLLYSANRWEKKEQILSTLNSGTHIIMDRYCYSGVAYSMAKGVDMEWCKNSDKGLPAPDILFFLDISAEEAQRRKGFGDERYEVSEFQVKVNSAYTKLRDDSWTVINVDNRTVEEIVDTLVNYIDDYLLKNASSLPIKTLW